MTQFSKKNSAWWKPGNRPLELGDSVLRASILRVAHPICLVQKGDDVAVARDGVLFIGQKIPAGTEGYPLLAYVPPLHPEDLGDPIFKRTYALRYAYIVGAMAKGITSIQMVEEAGRAGMIGFFGAAGLPLEDIDAAVLGLQQRLGVLPYGFNLIHSPNDPELEAAVVELYLKRGVRLVSASAYLDLTLPLVYYRVKGIRQNPDGRIVCPNRIIAKVSRVEVARKFFSPPPEKLLAQLLERNRITRQEFDLARSIALADDLTAEADSGGHTDNRPAISLLPTLLALRDEMAERYRYPRPPCVGLGGGIATPESTAAAFAMGAAYVLTGSVNQSCVEAGTSETVRRMLAETGQADVTMAPSADMFEMGVKVQVLKRGTMFPLRAAKLYELYGAFDGLDAIPEKQRLLLERDIFRCSLQEEWEMTKSFFIQRDPKQIQRAETDPKHKMALIFRSYLGRSSTWANTGDPSRKIDYQIWCGPAMGAFNEWVKGSFLEKPENRKTVTVALNLLLGAAVTTRTNWLRNQNVILPPRVRKFPPMELAEILDLLGEPHTVAPRNPV